MARINCNLGQLHHTLSFLGMVSIQIVVAGPAFFASPAAIPEDVIRQGQIVLHIYQQQMDI